MVDKKSDQTYFRFLNFQINQTWIVPFLLTLGLILRLIRIAGREITYDDAFSFWLSLNSFSEIVRGTVADTMPPIYYFLLHLWQMISHDLWFLRLLNVIINIMALYLFYRLINDYFGKKQAIIALFFACITPFQLYHAQELRMYSVLLLGQIGFLYFLNKYLNQDKIFSKDFFFGIFFGSIAMYSHNLAIFGIVAGNALLLLNINFKQVKKLFLIQASVAMLFIPWAVYLPTQIDKIQTAFWTPRPGLLEIIQCFLTNYSFLPMPSIAIMAATLFVLQTLILVTYATLRNKNRKNIVFFVMVIIPSVLLIIVSYFMRPIYVPRAVITSSILFYGLIAEFIVVNWKKFIGKIILAFTIIPFIVGLPYFYTFESFPRSSFKQATTYLEEHSHAEDLILHDNKLSHFPMMIYGDGLNQVFLADIPGSENDTLAFDSQDVIGFYAIDSLDKVSLNQSIFFVVFEKAIEEYEEFDLNHPVIEELSAKMDLQSINQFGDVLIYDYAVKN